MNQCAFRHSDLSLLLNASMKPLSEAMPHRKAIPGGRQVQRKTRRSISV